MEQSHAGERHRHAVLVTAVDDRVITDGAAGLRDIFHAALVRSFDIVGEREERVRAERDVVDGVEIRSLLLIGEGSGLLGKILLPVAVGGNVLLIAVDIAVDDVVAVGTADILAEREVEHLVTLSEEPGIRLGACQTGAVDAALLTRADADRLTVYRVANRIRLGIFKGNQGNDQITHRALGQLLVLGDNILEQCAVDLKVVATLLKGDAVDLLMLDRIGNIIGVDLYDIVVAFSLGFEDLERLGLIAGGDDAVTYLALDHLRGGNVTDVAQRDPVAEGAHTVGTACARVSAGERRIIQTLDIIDKASLFELIGKRYADSRRGGADVLERGDSGQSERLLELLDELPGIERIEKIDIAGSAAQDLDRQLGAVVHKDLRGLLVGIATVF